MTKKKTTAALNPLHWNKVACPNSSKRNLREMQTTFRFWYRSILWILRGRFFRSFSISRTLPLDGPNLRNFLTLRRTGEEPFCRECERECEGEGEEGHTKTFVKSRALSRKHSSEWMTIANVWPQFGWHSFTNSSIPLFAYPCLFLYSFEPARFFFFPCLNLASWSKMFLKWLKALFIWVFF